MALATEKLLPQNVEAETGVLGSVMIDPDQLLLVRRTLRPEDFYCEAHRVIYQAMCDLYDANTPPDLITLCDELARRGKLDGPDGVGGASYVSSLTNQTPTSANIESYAAIVARTAVLRRLIWAAGQIAGVAYNEPDARVALAQAERLVRDVAAGATSHLEVRSQSYGELLDELFADILERMERRTAGIQTGLPSLDAQLGGFEPGDLIYVCGRPGAGKSALGVALATGIARRFYAEWQERLAGHVDAATGVTEPPDPDAEPQMVEIVTLEMRALQQVRRIVAGVANVNTRMLRAGFRRADGSVDVEAYHAVKARAYADSATLARTLHIGDRPTTLDQLRSDVLTAVATRRTAVVVLDQLDLLSDETHSGRGGGGKQIEYERITTFSRSLKQLAREAGVVFICLTQLSRAIESRQNKRPMLSDLRSSGQLEQDADFVMSLYRAAYYDAARARKEETFAQFAEVGLLKFRDGDSGIMVPLRYEGAFTRFSDWPGDWDWPADETRELEG